MKTNYLHLLLTSICLSIGVFSKGFAYTSNTLYGLYGDHILHDDGSITINKTGWNNLCVSQIEADAFVYKADIEFLDGHYASLVYGHTKRGFYGVEVATKGDDLAENEIYVKGFRDGEGGKIFFERVKASVVPNEPIHFRIQVTADGELNIEVNEVQIYQYSIENYQPGHLGILSFQTQVKFSNILVDDFGSEGERVELEALLGDYNIAKPLYTIQRMDHRDNFVLSQTEVKALTISGDVKITEGDRMSFVFGHKANDNWYGAELQVKDENSIQLKTFKVGEHGGDLFVEEYGVDTTKPIAYKIALSDDGTLKVYAEENLIKELNLPHYEGGKWGMLTWNSEAKVSDFEVVLLDDSQPYNLSELELNHLGGENSFYTKTAAGYIINRLNGNNFISSTTSATSFVYSGNIEVLEGDRMSFVFGSSGDISGKWYGAELLVNKNDNKASVKVFQEHGIGVFIEKHNIAVDASQPIPFKIDVTADGLLKIFVDNNQIHEQQIPNYQPGRLGFLTYQSKVRLTDVLILVRDELVAGNFLTNTEGWKQDPNTNGFWRVREDGLYGIGSNNSPYFSSTFATDFVVETDMKFFSTNTQAGGLVFRANEDHSVYYAIDINNNSETVRILKFYKNPSNGSISDVVVGGTEGNLKELTNYNKKSTFNIRVEAIKSSIIVYIDDELLVSASDDESLEGYFGVTNFSSEIVFQNMYYETITDLPVLTDLSVDIDLLPKFSTQIFQYNAIVPYEKESVAFNLKTDNTTNNIFLNDELVESGQDVSVALQEGENIIRIRVQNKETAASTITTLRLKRRYNPENAYTERYRPQFHYTPEAHWINDPNGMVFYDGEYHLFYQYHPYSKQWGPMHWGHAISTDMVHWEEYPIALYPDKFGTMFSGSAVVDHDNTTGFFSDVPEKKGMVAIYTNAGHGGQQQSIAYSLDKGRSWTKYNEGEPVIKIADDPLNHGDFRDPKVFWHDESNQWMMVIAGGPLRFYSSSNLIDWKYESGYSSDQTLNEVLVKHIFTECPDFVKLDLEGEDVSKWVLLGSGKFYMIGDFVKVDDAWHFIPDSNERIHMNFGHDNYAAQTFSDMPDDRTVMINWMTNFDYSGDLANVTDPYNGAFTMAYELKLKREPTGKLVVYQTPVDEYQILRKTPFSIAKQTVTKDDENILKDLKATQFEIVAEISPNERNAQFGFNLRTGINQYTSVYYNTSMQELVVSRTNSGAVPNDRFARSFTKSINLIDGKLKLHIFVDQSTIEVFANDGEAVATLLIFPDPESDGMEFFVKGNSVECTLDIYPLKTIWREDLTDPWDTSGLEQNITINKMDVDLFVANRILNVKSQHRNPLNIDLYSLDGRRTYSNVIHAETLSVPLDQGVHFVRLADKEQRVVQKICAF